MGVSEVIEAAFNPYFQLLTHRFAARCACMARALSPPEAPMDVSCRRTTRTRDEEAPRKERSSLISAEIVAHVYVWARISPTCGSPGRLSLDSAGFIFSFFREGVVCIFTRIFSLDFSKFENIFARG